ncbi:MAG: hypothetical protein P4L53_03555 [Candidatus Obscuribacterales bacterium]|nr:hypothetical protein [Candidatus Obscuribacterales bacterium]
MKVLGGGREVANATDSGILNVVKQTMATPNVSPAGTSFAYCGIPAGNNINLYSYNRCVGQAMLVALNAMSAGTATAGDHAASVLNELNNNIALPLRTALTTGSGNSFDYQSAFTQLTGMNSTKMNGNNIVNAPGYGAAWMLGGTSASVAASSNLYFEKDQFGPQISLPTGLFNTNATIQPPPDKAGTQGNYPGYVLGYTPFKLSVNGSGGMQDLYYTALPVFPMQMPHLVSIGDFNANTNGNFDNFVPPNAFKVSSKSLDSNSSTFGGSVACALVGSVDPGYAVSMPAGYVEIFNRPGTTLSGIAPTDNSNNIFNNEMFNPPGISLSVVNGASGPAAVFSNVPGSGNSSSNPTTLVDDWASYNSGSGSGGPGGGGGAPSTSNIFAATNPQQAGLPATRSVLSQIKAPFYTGKKENNCLTQLQQAGYLQGNCLNWLNSMALTYGRTLPNGQGTDMSTMGAVFSNVDVIKYQVINAFQNHMQGVAIVAPAGPTYSDNAAMNGSTGMGMYEDKNFPGQVLGATHTYPSPYNTMPIMKPKTPYIYLQQIDAWGNSNSCGTQTVMNQIYYRCKQIQPNCTLQDVQNLLASNSMPMGEKFYIYLPKADQTASLVMDAGPPPAFSSAVPDGQPVDPTNHCQGEYGLVNKMVDVTRNPQYWGVGPESTAISEGDLNLHAQPYYGPTTPLGGTAGLTGIDHALWQTSSGYGNLLGHLEFANTVLGGNMFNTPN